MEPNYKCHLKKHSTLVWTWVNLTLSFPILKKYPTCSFSLSLYFLHHIWRLFLWAIKHLSSPSISYLLALIVSILAILWVSCFTIWTNKISIINFKFRITKLWHSMDWNLQCMLPFLNFSFLRCLHHVHIIRFFLKFQVRNQLESSREDCKTLEEKSFHVSDENLRLFGQIVIFHFIIMMKYFQFQHIIFEKCHIHSKLLNWMR